VADAASAVEIEASQVDGLGAAPIGRAVVTLLASTLSLAAIGWALGLPTTLRLEVYDAQFYGGMFALALPLAFLVYPARRRASRARVPWYDWALAVAGFAGAGYLVVSYQGLVDLVMLRPLDGVVVGGLVLGLALEALRRATGLTLVVVSLGFVAYGLFGSVLPGRLSAQPVDWNQLVPYLALDTNGVLGSPLAVATTIIVLFILFGNVLNAAGGSRFFADLSLLSIGRMRGGPAKVAVVGSALMGTITGSAVANVATVGVVTIPLIRRAGYSATRAAAIEAVGSTGGQILPPVMGAAAFLMAEFLAVPYSTVAISAAIPGVLYYLALFIQVDLDAGKRGIGGVAETEIPKGRTVLGGAHFALPFAALLVAMIVFNTSPQLAALIAVAVTIPPTLILGYAGRRPSWRELAGCIRGAGVASLEIILVCVAAGIVIGVLAITGMSFNLSYVLVQVGEGNLLLLLVLTALVSMVLGMGLPTVSVYVLLAALVAPALIQSGIAPIPAHLFVMYFGMMSMITPPVAMAAFAAATIARADPMATGWESVKLAWSAFIVPFLFVLSPTLVMIGAPLDIVIAFSTAGAGVWLVSIGIVGFFLRPLGAPMRLAFGAAGLLALVPAGAFAGAVYTDVVGVLAGAALLLNELRLRRAAARTDRSGAGPSTPR
jgi:TRAP transporter 4TM/12TM fusion protein